MNENLRCSQELAFQEIQLGEQIVRFNGRCECDGIVRNAGGAFLDTPKEINETTLRDARKYPDLFKIKEAGKKLKDAAAVLADIQAHTDNAKTSAAQTADAMEANEKTAIDAITSQAVEVNGKTVIDAPVEVK